MTVKQYESMYCFIRERKSLCKLLKVIDRGITAFVYLSYFCLLALLFFQKKMEFLEVFVVPAVAFCILSVVRKKINAKRPYEVMEHANILRKKSMGNSFPSRHVFSVYLIGTSIFGQYQMFAWILFVLGGILAIVRVVGGVHYIKDVVCGAAAGVGMGFLGILLFHCLSF